MYNNFFLAGLLELMSCAKNRMITAGVFAEGYPNCNILATGSLRDAWFPKQWYISKEYFRYIGGMMVGMKPRIETSSCSIL